MPRHIKYMIVTAMKNEGPYILEWVAHHMALGFGHIVVVTNDCDDGTTRILDRLAELGHVTHVPNPKMLHRNRGAWQVMALRYTRFLNIVRDAEWILHCDVDEFVQLKTTDPSLDGFLDTLGPTGVVSFTSIPFNSGGRKELTDAPTVSQFTQTNKKYSEATPDGPPILNAIKTMYRNNIEFQARRNHRPLLDDFSHRGLMWRNGSGKIMDQEFTDGTTKAMDALTSVQFAQLNHYAIRSVEAYLLKLDRGDVAGTDRLQRSLAYWTSYNTDGDDDLRWAQPSDACTKLFAGFLQDPELGELHERAFASHKEKLTRILETDQGKKVAKDLGYYDT